MIPGAPIPSRDEFERGRWDVARWALVYLGIRLHPGQIRMAEAYLQRTSSGWRAQNLWIMVSAGNRAGKTLALAVIILHSCVYRMGLKPPDDLSSAAAVRHWATQPYHWWHFAVEQTPAEQVFTEIALILGGRHPAQRDGCPWSDLLGEGDSVKGAQAIATLSDMGHGWPWCNGPKERGEYAWIRLAPQFGGAEIHFRSTKAKALSAIGQNMSGLSMDEAGLEPNLTYLLEEVMHARRLGTGGQFILISTPSIATGTAFQDLWDKGDPESPFREPRRISLRMSSRDNIGYGLDEESFAALISGMSQEWIAQNIDGYFLQSSQAWFNANSVNAIFHADLPEEQEPRPGGVYIQALDPGLKDKCWSVVFEVLPEGKLLGVHIERQWGRQTTRGIVALGVRNHQRYQLGGKAWCETAVDTTALGGHMFRELLEEHIPIKSVEFGGYADVKRRLLSDLRTAIDEGRLILPASGEWQEVRQQLLRYKLADRKIEQDLVMALAMAVRLLRQAPQSLESAPVILDMTRGADAFTKGSPLDWINPRSIRNRIARQRRLENNPVDGQ